MSWSAREDRECFSASSLVIQRLSEGCIVPSVSSVSKTALMALDDLVCQCVPFGLTSAKRSEALVRTPDNGVPESYIVECMISDCGDAYLRNYAESAKRHMKTFDVSSAKAARKMYTTAYWDYLMESSGIATPSTGTSSAAASAYCKRTTSALLFHSTFGGPKPLVGRPFKDRAYNSAYRSTYKELRTSVQSVQKYAYYMRPEDVMSRSEDTAARLEVVLGYVDVCYRASVFFMDEVDKIALSEAGYVPSPFGPRELSTPDKLFVKYAREGSRSATAAGGTAALLRICNDSFMCFLKMCSFWGSAKWRGKYGPGLCRQRALVAAVDLLTCMHHHCQYLLNLLLAGYVCWAKGGVRNESLMSAVRQQGRFCHFFGRLTPTVTSQSWSAMEAGVTMWFKMAVARGVTKYGGPTPHYLLAVNAIPASRNEQAERRRFERANEGRRSERRTGRQALTRRRPASIAVACDHHRGGGNKGGVSGASTGALFLGDSKMANCRERTDREDSSPGFPPPPPPLPPNNHRYPPPPSHNHHQQQRQQHHHVRAQAASTATDSLMDKGRRLGDRIRRSFRRGGRLDQQQKQLQQRPDGYDGADNPNSVGGLFDYSGGAGGDDRWSSSSVGTASASFVYLSSCGTGVSSENNPVLLKINDINGPEVRRLGRSVDVSETATTLTSSSVPSPSLRSPRRRRRASSSTQTDESRTGAYDFGLGPGSSGEGDGDENEECSDSDGQQEEEEDDDYWYANDPSGQDAYACIGDPDPYDTFFGTRIQTSEWMKMWPSGCSGEEGDEGESDDKDPIYESMDEINARRELQQLQQRLGIGAGNSCQDNVGAGKDSSNAVDDNGNYSSPVPFKTNEDDGGAHHYDVPSSNSSTLPVVRGDNENTYDVPRRTVLKANITVVNDSGVTVQYDVPRPAPTVFSV